jgi:hypothetical protein
MEVMEFWKTLIPSQYVTLTKCYCVAKKPISRSEYDILKLSLCAVSCIDAYINK